MFKCHPPSTLRLENVLRYETPTIQADVRCGLKCEGGKKRFGASMIIMYAAQLLRDALYNFLICLQDPKPNIPYKSWQQFLLFNEF